MDQSSDPTIILIKNIFEIMLSSFSAGDAKGVAEHLEFPALGINSPTTAFNSKEKFIAVSYTHLTLPTNREV